MDNGNKGPMNLDVIDYVRREKMVLLNLTEGERRFCEEYVRHFDRRVAYRDAGYDVAGFSGEDLPGVDDDIEKLIAKPNVSAYLLLLRESVASRLGVSLDMIVEEYRRMAFANMGEYVSWSDKGMTVLKGSAKLTEAQRAGVMEIVETTTKAGTTVKIKLFPKQAALDRLFDILKELEDRQEKPKTNKIDNMQVNVILADPVKRRAIEHLATGMFNRQVMLVENDEDALQFNEHMRKITEKFQGVARGSRKAGVGAVAAHAGTEGAGSGRKGRGNNLVGKAALAQNSIGLNTDLPEDKESWAPSSDDILIERKGTIGEDISDAEIAESERYSDIPGL